ncbi:glycoside hydrolase [Alkalimonas collagenimarina]|uniref:Glycoside hydrolase n=1 Tax=Alkalimonas collagenimarina TaxID=400390 RepID=A0ABT9H0D3_9GAMM|nr:glycoside hydrolase [Alkalimonas collagenimarina]MDP4536663.1 glycoside hydrolase [Alkalimonas collagenimarina]
MRWYLAILVWFYSCQSVQASSLSFTLQQALDWSEKQAVSELHVRASEPLAPRSIPEQGQLWPELDPRLQVLIAPDGMDNLAFEQPQSEMNYYLFRHWSSIDVLNWFAGTADNTVNLPAASWVDVAHRNGVKVIGSVFFAPTAWGGQPERLAAALQQDEQGGFPLADKLLAMATFYGFDGWLMNQETDLSALPEQEARHIASQMQQFMAYLMQQRPEGMEIHWYDAMLTSGAVRWQNEYNNRLADFLRPEQDLLADAVFLNYFWKAGQPQRSHQLARQHGVDPFRIFTGADLWPGRNDQPAFRDTRWLSALFQPDSTQAWTSLALFGVNFTYRFDGDERQAAFHQFSQNPAEVQQFYQTEQRLFAGDSLNAAGEGNEVGWAGLQRYIPARTVSHSLPFYTSFNTGHGNYLFDQGERLAGGWHDIRQQDRLPSWQFAVLGAGEAEIHYDFEHAWQGGSSLQLQADTRQGSVVVPLYLTELLLTGEPQLTAVSRQPAGAIGLQLWLELDDGSTLHYELPTGHEHWQQQRFPLADYVGQTIQRIGIYLPEGISDYKAWLGQLAIE